jgi:AcrR family transcriptional regulator
LKLIVGQYNGQIPFSDKGFEMARRSDHTREELNDMALDAARRIAAEDGLRGLATRRIAGEIGYTAGTLYQLFDDLDDLIMRLNGATLDALYLRCKDVSLQGEPEAVLQRLANRYMDFVTENPRLWTAVVEHNLPNRKETPKWYREKIGTLLGLVEVALSPLYSPARSDDRAHDARVLWGSLYGIASLASADKLAPNITPQQLALSLISNYVTGLRARRFTSKRRKVSIRSSRSDRSRKKLRPLSMGLR